MDSFRLDEQQLAVSVVHRNPPPSALYEHAIRYEKDASIAENGALVAYSGVRPGGRRKTSASSIIPIPTTTSGGVR
jgi:phosphoenolpyruvate carboxykinase (ATP)